MHPTDFTDRIKNRSRELGFSRVGVCPAVTPEGLHHLCRWIEQGHAGEMAYLEKRRDAYRHPDSILAGCRSLVALAIDYGGQPPRAATTGTRIARYASGQVDYHDWIHGRLKQLQQDVRTWQPAVRTRGIVDTAPLLEREFAMLAGLGWQAKNTMLISREAGSWFFLAFLLLDTELVYDEVHSNDYCGTCTACMDACPTQAFPEPHVLDATRCISYLTIEHRSSIPAALRSGIGDWLFGCDVCQDVCPWNRFAPHTDVTEFGAQSANNPIDAIDLMKLDEAAFRARFRDTPLWRAKRRGILRNAAIVLGNQRARQAIPVLIGALYDEEPLVRAAAAWSLGQFDSDDRVDVALERALRHESSAEVVEEIHQALRPPCDPPEETP